MMAMTGRAPFFLKPAAKMLVGGLDKAFFGPRLKALMSEIERALGEHKWFAGDSLTGVGLAVYKIIAG